MLPISHNPKEPNTEGGSPFCVCSFNKQLVKFPASYFSFPACNLPQHHWATDRGKNSVCQQRWLRTWRWFSVPAPSNLQAPQRCSVTQCLMGQAGPLVLPNLYTPLPQRVPGPELTEKPQHSGEMKEQQS